MEEVMRDIKVLVNDETVAREAAVRACVDAIMEEKSLREDGLARERRLAEEETSRAQQFARKAREEEERRLQERLLELSSAVAEERDLRNEAMRMERQKAADQAEQLSRDVQGAQRETTKVSKQLEKALEELARRNKEVDAPRRHR